MGMKQGLYSTERLYEVRDLLNDVIGEIENDDAECDDYIRRCSHRASKDSEAFIEILRLTQDDEIGAFEACVKIAGICQSRLSDEEGGLWPFTFFRSYNALR